MKHIFTFLIAILIITGGIFYFNHQSAEAPVDTGEVVIEESSEETLASEELPETAIPVEELEEIDSVYVEENTPAPGLSIDEKLAIINDELHDGNSGLFVRESFDDLEYMFDWTSPGSEHRPIFPFFYYYSESADTTFVICNIDKTVAVCDGRQDEVIEKGVDSDHCNIARPFENQFL